MLDKKVRKSGKIEKNPEKLKILKLNRADHCGESRPQNFIPAGQPRRKSRISEAGILNDYFPNTFFTKMTHNVDILYLLGK